MLWQTTSRILPTPPPRPPPPAAAAAVPAPAPTPTTTTTTTTATPTTCVYLKKTWRLGDLEIPFWSVGAKVPLNAFFLLLSVVAECEHLHKQESTIQTTWKHGPLVATCWLVDWLVGWSPMLQILLLSRSLSIAICWHCWASKTTSCQPLSKPSFKADPLIIITPS